jgi:hypothetical protein
MRKTIASCLASLALGAVMLPLSPSRGLALDRLQTIITVGQICGGLSDSCHAGCDGIEAGGGFTGAVNSVNCNKGCDKAAATCQKASKPSAARATSGLFPKPTQQPPGSISPPPGKTGNGKPTKTPVTVVSNNPPSNSNPTLLSKPSNGSGSGHHH